MEKFLIVLILTVVTLTTMVNSAPSFNSQQLDDIHPFGVVGKVIDINNLDPDDEERLKQMNINLTALREQQQTLKNRLRQQNSGGGDASSDIASDEGFRRPLTTNPFDQPIQMTQNLSVRQT